MIGSVAIAVALLWQALARRSWLKMSSVLLTAWRTVPILIDELVSCLCSLMGVVRTLETLVRPVVMKNLRLKVKCRLCRPGSIPVTVLCWNSP